MELTFTAFALFFIAAMIAETIGTVAGFGAATILIPISTFFFDIKTTIGIVGLFHFFGQLFDGFLWRRFIVWRIGLYFAVLGVLFSFIGALLISYIPSRSIEIALGAFLILFSVSYFMGKRLVLPHSKTSLILTGGVIGFIAGLIGTAGALRSAALSSLNLTKEHFLGTSFAIAFLVDLTRITVYMKSGILNVSARWWISIMLIAIIGSLIGRALTRKISSPVFYTIIYGALFIAGIKFIFFN